MALSSLSVLVRAFQPWDRLVASCGMLNARPVFVVLSAGFKRKTALFERALGSVVAARLSRYRDPAAKGFTVPGDSVR